MGEEPAAPEGFRATNTSCGALSLEWDRREGEGSLSFPVHKFVLRRAPLKQGESTSAAAAAAAARPWTTVMQGPDRGFFDSRVKPGAGYRYSLQAWNALGHSSAVEIDVVVATEDCVAEGSWWWLGSGGGGIVGLDYLWGVVVAAISLILGAAYLMGCAVLPRRVRPKALRSLSNSGRGEGQEGGAVSSSAAAAITASSSSPMSSAGASGGWSDRHVATERRRSSASCIPVEPATVNSSRRLQRIGSAPLRKHSAGHEVVTGTLLERRAGGAPVNGRLDPRPETEPAVASMRKEAARRLMTRQSTSKEDKEFCGLCGREWKW